MRVTLLLVFGALAVLYAFDPATTAYFPSCPFFHLTGWYCPGCGTLRAVHALLHGHVGRALHDNPFTLAAGSGMAAAAAIDRMRESGTPGALARLTSPPALAILAAAAVAFGVARNVPIQPFLWMTP